MAIEMTKEEYKGLLLDTVNFYSLQMKNQIKKMLVDDGRITFDAHKKDVSGGKYPLVCSTIDDAIRVTTDDENFVSFYEYFEFIKYFKYSLPLMFEWADKDYIKDFDELLNQLVEKSKMRAFNKNQPFEIPNFVANDVKKCVPYYMKEGAYYLFKFILQKTLTNPHTFETFTFRYPVVVSLNFEKKFVEIRFDGVKYGEEAHRDYVKPFIDYLIKWLKDTLQFKLFEINADEILEKIKSDSSSKAVIYKQLMEMKSGGSAELTASDDMDYILPFIGEIKELMVENSDLFENAPEIKKLLEEYLEDKELTANYPYIYVRWLDAIKSREFVVKLVFNYYDMKYLQMHNMQCPTRLTKERMDYAIEYLFESGSFTRGEAI